jgi:ATP-binding cassette subfamily B protein
MSFFANLDTERYDRQYSDRQLLQRMAQYFRPYSRTLGWIIFILLGMSLLGAAQPWIVGRGVDILKERTDPASAALPVLAVLVAGVLVWLLNWLRRRLTARVVGNVILDIRTVAFRAAADHDLSFYDQYQSGRIVSRITSDTQEFGQIVLLVTDVISQFIEAFLLMVLLFQIEWRLALLLLAFLPLIFLTALGFRRLARDVTRRGMRAMANVNAVIKETVSGILVAKNFRQERTIFSNFEEANRQSYQVNVRRGLVLSLVFPALNTVGGVSLASLVYAGGLSASQGAVTVGAWYLFLLSMDRFFFPLLNLSAFWAQVQAGLSAAERTFALIDAEPAVVQTHKNQLPLVRGEIRFEKVDFSYKTGEPVLQSFDLTIAAGENLALVGHTGAGKSSIGRLVARFYEYQAGKILVDGMDIRSFDLASYRRSLGIVAQNPFLFSGTVLENACYAMRSGEDPCEVERLARQIGGGEWLDHLPDGLQTQVGERGSRLSMGQRQLVALLRVLVQKPAIFILDEATASIDPFTEWQIQQAIDLLMRETTSILIAHRLSTVIAADRILVMEKGRITEQGNHRALLQAGEHYAKLYNTYFRHQSPDYKPEGINNIKKIKFDA